MNPGMWWVTATLAAVLVFGFTNTTSFVLTWPEAVLWAVGVIGVCLLGVAGEIANTVRYHSYRDTITEAEAEAAAREESNA